MLSLLPSVHSCQRCLFYQWSSDQPFPRPRTRLSHMILAIHSGKAKSMVRVGGYQDRAGIQQALDCGADGILIPYINTAAEAKEGISCCKYPTTGTRSVYFPQRATNKKGLLGYVGNANDNVIVALQVRRNTHPCRRLSSRQSTLAASGPAVDPTPAPSPAGPPAQACPHGRLPAPVAFTPPSSQ